MIDNTALLISSLLLIYVAYRAMRLDLIERGKRTGKPLNADTPERPARRS